MESCKGSKLVGSRLVHKRKQCEMQWFEMEGDDWAMEEGSRSR